MADRKKKQYWSDPNIELTTYAKKKLRKLINKSQDNANDPDGQDHYNEPLKEVGEFSHECATQISVNEIEEADTSTQELKTGGLSCMNDERNDINVQEGELYSTPNSLNLHNLSLDEENNRDEVENFNFSMTDSLHMQTDEIIQIVDELYSSDDDDNDVLEILRKKNEKPTTADELKNQEGFLESIGTTVNMSPGELLLMTLKFSLVNKLSFTGLTSSLKLVNRICGDQILPVTRYQVDKLCNDEDKVTLHGVCPICSKYIETFGKLNKSVNCSNCSTTIDLSNPSNPCFFALIDPSDAIRGYLESYEDYYYYVMNERVHETDHIKDIYDGKQYRKFVRNLPTADSHAYVTVMFNTDGAPVFKSSNYSIWPIYIMPNEIPVQDRFNTLIEVGLWFGKSKPEMSVFLEKFVEDMNELSTSGIPCKIKGEELNAKLFPVLAAVDTMARGPMNGTSQCNAYYGCDWCEHPGEYFEGCVRFPFLMQPIADRNRESTIRYAQEALENQTVVRGVKSASPLLNLNGFDIIKGFTPEYLHCYLAGVAKQFTTYLLDLIPNDDIDAADDLLLSIKVPHQISRLTRSLSDRGHWKAREWENWVLYCSVPILNTVLKSKTHLRHWSLLVDSLHILLKMDITFTQLNEANEMLHLFVLEARDLYSLSAMTYNTHQLLHIAKSVNDWGPLWAHSAFYFESANRKLLQAIKSAKGVISQVIRSTNIERFVQVLERVVYPQCSPIVVEYCENVNAPRVKKIFKMSSITYFGREKILDSDYVERFSVTTATKVFSKMVMKGCLFTSSKKPNKRSCNNFVQLSNGSFIQIVDFLVDTETRTEITIYRIIKTKANKISKIIKEVQSISDEIYSMPTTEIDKVSVFIETDTCTYIIPVPNSYFY